MKARKKKLLWAKIKTVQKEEYNLNNIYFNKGYTDINPVLFGYEKCKSLHTYGPHIRNCYLIHYVVSGKGKFYKKDFEASVNAGQAFLIRPDEVTTYTADKDEPWEYIWIGFDGVAAKKLDDIKDSVFENITNQNPPFVPVDIIHNAELENVSFKNLHSDFSKIWFTICLHKVSSGITMYCWLNHT